MQSFYKLPKNTVDAVYIGSSGVKEFYIAPEGFADNGIAVYPIAASHQSSAAIPYLIEEVHKTARLPDRCQRVHHGGSALG